MKLKITKKLVKKLKVVSTYRLKVAYYSDERSSFDSTNEKEIIEFLLLLSEYIKRANNSWNDWCNVERYLIMKVVNDLNLNITEEDIFNFWEKDSENEFLALPTSYKVTYFNDEGVEVYVDIEGG